MIILLAFMAGFLVLWLLVEIYIQIQLFQLLRDCLKDIKDLEDSIGQNFLNWDSGLIVWTGIKKIKE